MQERSNTGPGGRLQDGTLWDGTSLELVGGFEGAAIPKAPTVCPRLMSPWGYVQVWAVKALKLSQKQQDLALPGVT